MDADLYPGGKNRRKFAKKVMKTLKLKIKKFGLNLRLIFIK